MPDEIYGEDGLQISTGGSQLVDGVDRTIKATVCPVDVNVNAQEVRDSDIRKLLEQMLIEQIETNNLLRKLVAGMDGDDEGSDEDQESV